MAIPDISGTATLQELLVTGLEQTDAVEKLLIEKGLITEAEFTEKLKSRVRLTPHSGTIFHALTSLR